MIAWYDANAEVAAARYERVTPERVHGWVADPLATAPAATLDIGAGSGRTAARLSSRGYDVVAVEPSPRMRTIARERHAEPAIRWLADSLPAPHLTGGTDLTFDLILLSAVWMHVAPADRACGGPGWQCGCPRLARDSARDGGSARGRGRPPGPSRPGSSASRRAPRDGTGSRDRGAVSG